MSKVSLASLSTLRNDASAIATLNANFLLIQSAFDNTLSLDGTLPNTTTSTIDMNGQRLVNLPAPTTNTEPMRLIDLPTTTASLTTAIAATAASATAAASSATTAAGSATAAAGSATAAASSATTAATSATNSAGSATTAANTAATMGSTLYDTSATSFAVGTGSKAFTVSANKAFQVGQYILIASAGAPSTNFMFGNVTAYSGTTLTINVTVTGGSGTHTDWQVSISGVQGATGATGSTGASGGGSGNVVAPASAVVGHVVLFNNVSGTLLSDGGNASTVGLAVLSAASTSAARTAIATVIGTDVQAWSTNLDFLATSGSNTASAYRTLLGSVIGTNVQAWNAQLDAISGLVSAADKVPYFTGSNTASLATFTATGRLLIGSADAATARTNLGLGTAATGNTGTSANNLIQLDGSAKLPAVDGSQLTNVPSTGSVPTSTQVIAGNSLTGGGALTANVTLNMAAPGTLTGSTANTTNGVGGSHTHSVNLAAADVIPGSYTAIGAYIGVWKTTSGTVAVGSATPGSGLVIGILGVLYPGGAGTALSGSYRIVSSGTAPSNSNGSGVLALRIS